MSAEIPGANEIAHRAPGRVTELVSKIMVATGHEAATSYVYGEKIGRYAVEVVFTALQNANLLSPDFSIEAFNDAVRDIDQQMGLDSMVAEVETRERQRS